MRAGSRMVALLALVLGASLLAGCKDGDDVAEKQAQRIVTTLIAQAGPPQPGEFTAIFDQASFTTTYAVEVNLAFGAQQDEPSRHLRAKWTGPNCGTFGIVNLVDRFEPGKGDWDFGYIQYQGTAGARTFFRWVHPHPPCGNTPDHKDVTIAVVVSNPSGSFTCTYVGAATGKGTCK